MAAVFVQAAQISTATTGPLILDFPGVSAVGNFLVACIAGPTAGITPTVTDRYANTWIQRNVKLTTNGADFYCFYTFNVASSISVDEVTVTWSGTSAGSELLMLEYSGINSVTPNDGEVDSSSNGVAGTAITAGTLTTTNTQDLLLCYVGANSALTNLAPAGWTVRSFEPNFTDSVCDRIVLSTGSYTFSATTTSGQWSTRLMAFQIASSTLPSTVQVAGRGTQTLTVRNAHDAMVII